MKKIKLGLVTILLAISFQGFAQDNVFLDRKFWGSKPDVETVKAKIAEGNNPAEANGNNFDAVVYSTLQDAPLESTIYLISQKGNDVNKLTHDGRTYIFWAAYKGNVKLVEYLLKNGAKTDITDDKGNTIINFAAGAGQNDTAVYDLLIESNPKLITKPNPNGSNAILLAAPSDKEFKLTTYFQSKGLDINSKDINGNGIFNYAAKAGNIEMMNALLKKGIKGSDQAFIFAANGARGTTNGVKVYMFLNKVGLSPIVSNKEGETPLHIVAKSNKDFEVINYFLKTGLDVNAVDHNGNNAVMNAASGNSLEVVKHLSRNLKSINTLNKKGQSALTLAVAGNDAEVVGFLIENGYQTSILDNKGNNLAYYLIDSYSPRSKKAFHEKLELLQSNNVDLSIVQKDGNTWFHLAVEKNSIDLLELAVKMNQDINAKNQEGNTALHLAALKATDDAILKFLIKNGAKKELLTDFDESAYDLAKENELLKKNNISIKFLK